MSKPIQVKNPTFIQIKSYAKKHELSMSAVISLAIEKLIEEPNKIEEILKIVKKL